PDGRVARQDWPVPARPPDSRTMPAKTAPGPEDTRYPRSAIAEVIESALAGSDYAHLTEWIRPQSCPCITAGESCLAYQAHNPPGCQSYPQEVPLPSEQSLTAAELVAALPEPDEAGMVDAQQAGHALGGLAATRLAWSPY